MQSGCQDPLGVKVDIMAANFFNALEQAWLHHTKYKYMDGQDWASWKYLLDDYMGKPYTRQWWASYGHTYSGVFAQYIKLNYKEVVLDNAAEFPPPGTDVSSV